MNDTSNFALWATIGTFSPPIHSINFFTPSSSFILPTSISSVICVTSIIFCGNFLFGSISSSNESSISPFLILVAPISIIESAPPALKPVVSRSNTTYVASNIPSSVGLITISILSSTITSSHPYITLKGSSPSFKSLFIPLTKLNAFGNACTPSWSVTAIPLCPHFFACFIKSSTETTPSI